MKYITLQFTCVSKSKSKNLECSHACFETNQCSSRFKIAQKFLVSMQQQSLKSLRKGKTFHVSMVFYNPHTCEAISYNRWARQTLVLLVGSC